MWSLVTHVVFYVLLYACRQWIRTAVGRGGESTFSVSDKNRHRSATGHSSGRRSWKRWVQMMESKSGKMWLHLRTAEALKAKIAVEMPPWHPHLFLHILQKYTDLPKIALSSLVHNGIAHVRSNIRCISFLSSALESKNFAPLPLNLWAASVCFELLSQC